MTLDDFVGFVTWIDSLSDDDFGSFYQLMFIRSLRRARKRSRRPGFPRRGALEDCHPNGKRKGAAPDTL